MPKRVYKYLGVDGTISSLGSKCLRFSSPLTFNDPFDMQWSPFWYEGTPSHAKVVEEAIVGVLTGPIDWGKFANRWSKEQFSQWRLQIAALRADQRIPHARGIAKKIAEVDPLERLEKWLQMVEPTLTKQRVLCTSEDPTSVLMWSHYAERHQGFVFEIDVACLARAIPSTVVAVEYLDDLPRVHTDEQVLDHLIYGKPISEESLKRYVDLLTSVKARDWAYEREVRFGVRRTLAPDSAPGKSDFQFGDSIKKVIAGIRSSASSVGEVRRLLAELPGSPQLVSATPHPMRFAVNVP